MSDIKTFSLTFGDVAENHKGMQKIGTLSNNGFNLDDINKMKIHNNKEKVMKQNYKIRIVQVNIIMNSKRGIC